jgi:thiamine-phosphate diphosphorylase
VSVPPSPARPWLVLVSDRARLCAAAGRPIGDGVALLVEQARSAAAAGITAFQIREPDLDTRTLLALTETIAAIAAPTLQVLVNDRADVARAVGVGVHLRAASMPTARVRRWLPPPAWVTRAVHGVSELGEAVGADAVIAGTVRATPSKPTTQTMLGLSGLAEVVAACAVPVLGIGGLSGRDWPALRAVGAAGLAAIGVFLPRPGEAIADALHRAVSEIVDSPGGVT